MGHDRRVARSGPPESFALALALGKNKGGSGDPHESKLESSTLSSLHRASQALTIHTPYIPYRTCATGISASRYAGPQALYISALAAVQSALRRKPLSLRTLDAALHPIYYLPTTLRDATFMRHSLVPYQTLAPAFASLQNLTHPKPPTVPYATCQTLETAVRRLPASCKRAATFLLSREHA